MKLCCPLRSDCLWKQTKRDCLFGLFMHNKGNRLFPPLKSPLQKKKKKFQRCQHNTLYRSKFCISRKFFEVYLFFCQTGAVRERKKKNELTAWVELNRAEKHFKEVTSFPTCEAYLHKPATQSWLILWWEKNQTAPETFEVIWTHSSIRKIWEEAGDSFL